MNKENILSVIGSGDILLVVPPFGSIDDIAFGPHILQALAVKNGFKTSILYLNMLLASLIGAETYERIYFAPETRMLAERLFARRAYGLPPFGATGSSDLDEYTQIERICESFIDDIVPIIPGLGHKIVGVSSSMMRQTNCGIALLNGVKTYSPGVITIMGGGSCKGEMAEGVASLSRSIDYIFQGESETALLDFLKHYSDGTLPQKRIIYGSPCDLDDLPLVDYDIFFKQRAHFLGLNTPRKAKIWYETSRGCNWANESKCKFCGESRMVPRKKSPQTVVRDLQKIGELYPGQMVFMTDIAMPESYVHELFPLIEGKESFPSLGYQLRATLGLKELVTLKKANVDAALPGIETFSTHLLGSMNKGITGRESVLFLRNAACAGIYVDWILLWGFPYDRVSDYEEVLQILPLIRHLQPPRTFSPMSLVRFSTYMENMEKHSITGVRPWAAIDEVYPSWADKEKLAVYYTGAFPCESYKNPQIIHEISEQVEIWKKTWKNTTLAMAPFMDGFVVYDNRDFHEKTKTHILDTQQAEEIITPQLYNESGNLKWAVEEKLGIVMDSWYIPLVTTPYFLERK